MTGRGRPPKTARRARVVALKLARPELSYSGLAAVLGLTTNQVRCDITMARRAKQLPPGKLGGWRGGPHQVPGAALRCPAGCEIRACLGCGAVFPSEGNHNRLCERCRKRGDAGAFDQGHGLGGHGRVQPGGYAP